MKRFLWLLLSLALTATTFPALAGNTYYADAVSGNNGNNSQNNPAQPAQTVAGAMADGFGTQDGDTIYLSGTFREQLRLITGTNAVNNITIKQWPGRIQAVIRGDTPTTLTAWTYAGTAGVFDLTISAGTCAWWDNGGTHRTLIEGICDVVVDWDRSVDARGRHYGHLQRSSTSTAANMPSNSFYFTPATPAVSGGGGGTLRIKLSEGFTSDTALDNSGLTIAYVLGNRNGIEIGTPTYTTYPTWGSYTGANVSNLNIDGLHIYLWTDNGQRQNKPVANGAGEDSSAFGAGNQTGTVSIGYGIRPADCNRSTIQNCTFIDGGGYHNVMFVGDHCVNNTLKNLVIWGSSPNTASGNSSAGAFYTGPGLGVNNNIVGCRAYNVTVYKYTLLGRDARPIPFPYIGTDAGTAAAGGYYSTTDGFICHTNARGTQTGSGSAGAAGDTVTVGDTIDKTSHGMFDGEIVRIVDTTASGITAGTNYYVVSRTANTFKVSDTSGGTPRDLGAGACHWYSVSNSVLDVQFENCAVYESGDDYQWRTTSAAWTNASLTLTEAGSFRGAQVGQRVLLLGGTGVTTTQRSGAIISNTTANPCAVTTNFDHGLATGDQIWIYGYSGSVTIAGLRTVTVTGATTFTVPVDTSAGSTGTGFWIAAPNIATVATAAADGGSITLSCDINGSGGDIANGVVVMVEKNNSGCIGAAAVAGGRTAFAADRTNWRTYPVRYVRCRFENLANLITSNDGDVAYVGCRFDFSRAGLYGQSLSVNGGIFGSNSGNNGMGLFGCEVLMDLGNMTTARTKAFWNSNANTTGTSTPAPNYWYSIGTSYYNYAPRLSLNVQDFGNWTNSATHHALANRVYWRQSSFVHAYCSSTTGSGLGARGLFQNSMNWSGGGINPRTPMNLIGTYYANIRTDGWMAYGGGTNYGNNAGWFNVSTGPDISGVDSGQDPLPATIGTGGAIRNPYLDISGGTLQLGGQAYGRTSAIGPNTGFGFNRKKYSGHYGAWQYGPDWWKYLIPARNRNN